MNGITDVMKVCRLCLGTGDLISVFDTRIQMPKNMLDVIQITTGVTISPSDNVSQMLCFKCFNITIKMFKFRSSSIVNDLELKSKVKPSFESKLHKSVQEILLQYPTILLPSSIIKSNVSPVVNLSRFAVDDWLKEQEQRKMNEQIKIATSETQISPSPRNQQMSTIITENNSVSNEKQVSLEQNSGDASSFLEIEASQKEKRKNDLIEELPEKKKRKLENDNEDFEDSLLTVKYVTHSLFICDICNAILYSSKDLKRHKTKHMRCNLCKKKFKTMEETQEHINDNCSIRYIMNHLPIIKLTRCDDTSRVQLQKPTDRSSAADSTATELHSDALEPRSDHAESQNDAPEQPGDVYDDSENDSIGSLQIDLDEQDDKTLTKSIAANGPNDILIISDDEDDFDKTRKVDSPKLISNKNKSVINITKPKKVNLKNSAITTKTASVPAKRNIKIMGENVLDVNLNNSDTSLLKNILLRSRENIKENGVQTSMPSSNDIVKSYGRDKLFELKNLRKFLHFYKIPVNLSFSTGYSVRYNYEPTPFSKRSRTWSRMKIEASDGQKEKELSTTVTSQIDLSSPSGQQKEKRADSTNTLESIGKVNLSTNIGSNISSPAQATTSATLGTRKGNVLVITKVSNTDSPSTKISNVQVSQPKVGSTASSPAPVTTTINLGNQKGKVSIPPKPLQLVNSKVQHKKTPPVITTAISNVQANHSKGGSIVSSPVQPSTGVNLGSQKGTLLLVTSNVLSKSKDSITTGLSNVQGNNSIVGSSASLPVQATSNVSPVTQMGGVPVSLNSPVLVASTIQNRYTPSISTNTSNSLLLASSKSQNILNITNHINNSSNNQSKADTSSVPITSSVNLATRKEDMSIPSNSPLLVSSAVQSISNAGRLFPNAQTCYSSTVTNSTLATVPNMAHYQSLLDIPNNLHSSTNFEGNFKSYVLSYDNWAPTPYLNKINKNPVKFQNTTTSGTSMPANNSLRVGTLPNTTPTIGTVAPSGNTTSSITSAPNLDKVVPSNYYVSPHPEHSYSTTKHVMSTAPMKNIPLTNTMPPPANNFVPHRTLPQVPKVTSAVSTQSGNIIATAHTQINNQHRPLIRVRNVSELK